MTVTLSNDLLENFLPVRSHRHRFLETIEPRSPTYRAWWLFTTLCALATSIFTPWEIAFSTEPGLSPYTDPAAFAEYFLTSVFVVDIFIKLNVAFINKDDKIVFRRKEIATHYLQFMFWIDLIGVIPFNTIVDITMDSNGHQRGLALLRLARLVRAHRLWALFRDFEINTHFHLIATTLIRNLTIVFLVGHCAACLFYYIAREYGFDEDTWIGANLDLLSESDGEKEDISQDNWKKYVYSIYWSITTMTTVGYGDYSPKNIAEVIFATIYMLINIALNSYILGTITLVVIRADEITAQQRRGFEKIENFAKKHSLSNETLTMLRDHLRHNYYHQEAKDTELIDTLPSNVGRKVVYELYGKKLEAMDVFRDCSRNFICALLDSDRDHPGVCVEVYMPQDEILSVDYSVFSLNVILAGEAYMKDMRRVTSVDIFPLEFLLNDHYYEVMNATYSVIAFTPCSVLRIPFESIQRAFSLYPQDKEFFKRTVKDFVTRASPIALSNGVHNPTAEETVNGDETSPDLAVQVDASVIVSGQ